jgi:hypothetical protein
VTDDKSGSIDVEELERVMNRFGQPMNAKELNKYCILLVLNIFTAVFEVSMFRIILAADTNGDGTISFEVNGTIHGYTTKALTILWLRRNLLRQKIWASAS